MTHRVWNWRLWPILHESGVRHAYVNFVWHVFKEFVWLYMYNFQVFIDSHTQKHFLQTRTNSSQNRSKIKCKWSSESSVCQRNRWVKGLLYNKLRHHTVRLVWRKQKLFDLKLFVWMRFTPSPCPIVLGKLKFAGILATISTEFVLISWQLCIAFSTGVQLQV